MAIVRSAFSFEQFRAALQKFAYKIALEAVQTMKRGDLLIRAHGPRLETVETSEYYIKFYAEHAQFTKHDNGRGDQLSFDFEEKEYMNSNHRGKISFYAYPPEKTADLQKQVLAFIAELMGEEKPQPRFALAEIQRS